MSLTIYPTREEWEKQILKNHCKGGEYVTTTITTNTLPLPKPTESITVQEPMITLERSNRNLKGAYQTCINHLLLQAQSHQDKAAAVNIFDTVRIVELGKAKVLKEVAEYIADMVFSGCTEYTE